MASVTATDDSDNKTVMGHPAQAIPPSSNVAMANPQVMSQGEPSPPPPVYLHQLHRDRHSYVYLLHREQIRLYRLSVASMVLLVGLVCFLFMFLLIIRPHMPQLQIASLTVSPLSALNTGFSGTCNVSVIVTNPNRKLAVFYDDFRISLHYEGDKLLLSDVQVPRFAQPGRSDTFMEMHLPIKNGNGSVGNDVMKALEEDLGHGRVKFEVKIFSFIKLEGGGWRTRSQFVNFNCPDVMLGFSASDGSGAMLDPYKEFQVTCFLLAGVRQRHPLNQLDWTIVIYCFTPFFFFLCELMQVAYIELLAICALYQRILWRRKKSCNYQTLPIKAGDSKKA